MGYITLVKLECIISMDVFSWLDAAVKIVDARIVQLNRWAHQHGLRCEMLQCAMFQGTCTLSIHYKITCLFTDNLILCVLLW